MRCGKRGYILARGDRRGFVAVDHKGEAYAISRWTGFPAKQVRARMNDPDALPDTGTAHREAAKIVTDRLRELQAEQKRKEQAALARLTAEKQRKEAQQRAETERLQRQQVERAKAEEQERQARIRKGVFGLLDRVTGKRKRIETENQTSREMAKERDRQENGALVTRHRHVQAELAAKAEQTKHQARETVQELSTDMQRLKPLPPP